jgi:pyroglutamyl-peptidase
MKILVTGFDPFGGDTINPAIESVKRLPDRIGNAEIIKLEIPTVIGKSVAMIKVAMQLHQPDVVLSIGQAGGRPDITVERVGINIDDCRIKDNEGNQPVDMKVAADGPAAYFATLPIKAMVENIRSHDLPASISNSAGTFICNHVLYGVAHLVATEYPTMKSGFIHIPFLPQQVINKPGMPSMTLDAIVQGLVCAIEAIAENKTDIKTTGGTIH